MERGILYESQSLRYQNKYIGSDIRRSDDGITKAWRVINIKAGDEYSAAAHKYFPNLVRILKGVPQIETCAISVLQDGVHIPIHVGYYKGIMRYMIPVVVPKDRENVFLCVNEIKYCWTEGVGVLWDDTYPHKVYNYKSRSDLQFQSLYMTKSYINCIIILIKYALLFIWMLSGHCVGD